MCGSRPRDAASIWTNRHRDMDIHISSNDMRKTAIDDDVCVHIAHIINTAGDHLSYLRRK